MVINLSEIAFPLSLYRDTAEKKILGNAPVRRYGGGRLTPGRSERPCASLDTRTRKRGDDLETKRSMFLVPRPLVRALFVRVLPPPRRSSTHVRDPPPIPLSTSCPLLHRPPSLLSHPGLSARPGSWPCSPTPGSSTSSPSRPSFSRQSADSSIFSSRSRRCRAAASSAGGRVFRRRDGDGTALPADALEHAEQRVHVRSCSLCRDSGP